jgi:hypothetical protein
MSERPVFAREIEHDLDPADAADAYAELVDQAERDDVVTLEEEWGGGEPLDSRGRWDHDQPWRPWT